MTDRKFDFWRDHSLNYLEMAFGYDRRTRLQNPDGYGSRTEDCGDTVEMFLRVKNSRIQSVAFETKGGINTNACANTVSCLAEGKTIDAAREITPDQVVEFLETLPEEDYHCAELAVSAFDIALTNYQELQTNHLEETLTEGIKP